MLAAAVALHSVQLATNQNGALLLTWFLDTCTFPNRRSALAPQIVPELVHLCTHKVAYLTVLKIINQNKELDGRDKILRAMFKTANMDTLEAILSDHACGATLIFKILTTPFFDESLRGEATENIRHVLLKLKAQPAQGYKRLMDEVGLSTRTGSTGPREHPSAERPRPGSNHSQANGHMPPPQYNQFYPSMTPSYDMGMGMQRTDSVDSNPNPSPFTQPPYLPMFSTPQVSLQQLQYQQQLLARAAPSFGYPPIQNMTNSYGNPSLATDHYRNVSPIQPPQNMSPGPMIGQGFAPPGFGVGYGYGMGGIGAVSGMQGLGVGGGYLQQEQQVNGRRGRVCF
jgi:protein JSN1